MEYILIRHGKTDANRLTRAAFGKQGAPLNELGRKQASQLHDQLLKLNVKRNDPVAVSELLRTHETAQAAGLQNLVINKLLNEVQTPDPHKTNELVLRGELPPEALTAAKKLLRNPPKEKVWFTHGLVIAAVLVELGQMVPGKLVPDFCEVVIIRL